ELSHIGLLQLAGWLARWLTHWFTCWHTPGSDKILIAKLSLHFTKTLTTPLGPQTFDLHGRIPT
ncbi:hypothetical protein Pcinc_028742, partial [Petrolisthes cinctipes]